MHPPRPPFRPDLEGLRGGAILLVVLYHAGVPALAGGFVGVDVFFVLSGFFITGLLVREGAADGAADLGAFYGRRALRLLPPLLVVLAATLAAAWWLYAPIDRAAVAASARAVALSSGNVAFARGAVDYFGSGDDPLLHTWSLAVEQQFYLVWPPLLVLLALAAERVAERAAERRGAEPQAPGAAGFLLAGIVAVGALSLATSLWLTRTSPAWAFFALPTRLWEFALGGALAVATPREGPRGGAVLQAAGLLAVGGAVAAYSRATPYPGAAALVPALGTAALVAGGAQAPASLVSRALSAGWLRALGRLSYAWYLWHWPLVALGAVLDPAVGVPGRLAWSLIALALAWLTYQVVERSAQEGCLARTPAGWLAPAAFALSVGTALAAHGLGRAAERRAARPDQRAFAAAREDRMRHDCWATTVDALPGPCVFGDPRASTVVALLGDSHAEHWLGALDRAGRARGWKVVAMVKGGCPVADVDGLGGPRRAQRAAECARYREAMVQRIVALRPAAAILSSWDHYAPLDSAGPGPVTAAAWGQGLRRTYARLSAAGIPVAAVRGTPQTGFDVPRCLSRRAAQLPFAGTCTYERARSLSPAAVAAQTAAARGLRVGLVDMTDQVCAAPRCAVERDGVIVFTDDNHLTASFSRLVAPVFGARVAAALAPLGVRLP